MEEKIYEKQVMQCKLLFSCLFCVCVLCVRVGRDFQLDAGEFFTLIVFDDTALIHGAIGWSFLCVLAAWTT